MIIYRIDFFLDFKFLPKCVSIEAVHKIPRNNGDGLLILLAVSLSQRP